MSLPRFLSLAAASLGILAAAPAFAAVVVNATAGTASASYTTLHAAVDAINAGTHRGDITMNVTSNTSEGTTSSFIEASGTGSSSYTSILIRPSGGAARTIGGAITGGPLIAFNGARNVTIDGLNTGGNSLTIQNTSTAPDDGTCTIRFTDGASNNVVTRATVLGSSTGPAATTFNGTIAFGTDFVTNTGNNNNTISFCSIGPAGGNRPTKAIFGSGGTDNAAMGNVGNVITDNQIYDYFDPADISAGVFTNAGCRNWTITNNRFFQRTTRTFTGAGRHAAIWLDSSDLATGAQGFTVTGNVIGYATAAGTGTYAMGGSTGTFTGILLVGPTAGAVSTISGNTITAISLSNASSGTLGFNPFTGIMLNPGRADVNDNVIGSLTATGALSFTTSATDSVHVYGILSNDAADFAFSPTNNQIGGITATGPAGTAQFLLIGLRMETGADLAFNAGANAIGGANAPLRNSSTSTGAQAVGILTESARCSLIANTIQNLSARGTGATVSASASGIRITAAARSHVVSQNVISNLTNANTTTAASVIGIQFGGSTAAPSTISRNEIRQLGISSTVTTSRCNGIGIATGTVLVERNFIHTFLPGVVGGETSGILLSDGTNTLQNNMIRLGILADGTSDTVGAVLHGIRQLFGTGRFYHNSVYLGGTGVGGAARTVAMFNNATTARVFQNNIFVNARSNSASGTGKHYAFLGEAANITTDYNVFLAPGTGGVLGGRVGSTDYANLAAFQAGFGGDAHSYEADPKFIQPAGSLATVDLHISATAPTVVERGGLAIASVTDDFDGQARANFSPTDIGADAGDFVAVGAPPFAGTLSVTASQGRSLAIATADIIAVSSDPMSLALTVVSAGPGTAQGGTATLSGNTITYAPPSPQFTGNDVFSYTIQNSAGRTASGVVNVTVQAPAFPPLAGSVTRTSGANATFSGGVPGLGYAIEYTDSLTVAFQPLLDGNSQPVVVAADGTGSFNISQAAAAVPKRFFRARRQP